MVKQQHQLFVALLVLIDGAVVALATFIAWAARRLLIEGWWPSSWEHYPKESLVIFTVPLVLLCLRGFGLYLPRRDRSLASEGLGVLKACVAAMTALLALLYVLEPPFFVLGKTVYSSVEFAHIRFAPDRLQLTLLAAALPLALGLHRVIFRQVLRMFRRRGWNQRHVAVIGTGRLGQIVARTLERNSWTGIKVAYFVSHLDRATRTTCIDRPIRGGLNELESVLEQHKPDAIYLALPSQRANLLASVLQRLEKFPVDVRVVPDLNPRYLPQSMAVSELDGMPILSYRENPAHGIGGITKRALDIAGSSLGLLLFSPVMLLVAILVRLSGPGPLIFKQRRMTLGGDTFKIYKFRTMYHVLDETGRPARQPMQWTERDDPRITPIGRWLRKTSLDELPQLLNVLKGDMSLVGPRPERPELIMRFREDWRGYMLRQHVKAGITGWAQVNGHRGQSSLRKRLQYDLFYVRHWSVGFDLKILLLTLVRGWVHPNAH